MTWTSAGWRCGVNTSDIRPFWGRAFAYYGGVLVTLYLVGTLGLFGTMRVAGFPIGYWDIVWPPAWRHFDEIRGRHYFEKGTAALKAGRMEEARLALMLAYDLNPRNYEIALALAQLSQAGGGGLSDRIYAELIASYPEKAAETARLWGRSLLWRGEFARLAGLAAERLGGEPADAVGWLHALLFSIERSNDPAPLVAAQRQPGVSPETRALLQMAVTARRGDVAGVVRTLSAPLSDSASAYARRFQINFLLRGLNPRRGLELLVSYGEKLPVNERVALSLDAFSRLGAKEEIHRESAVLMDVNPRPQIYEILGTHLIRHPDRKLLREVSARFAAGSWAETSEGMPANAALFCAAILAGDVEQMELSRARLRRVTASRANVLSQADGLLLVAPEQRQLRRLLPALPMLPLESVYAIFERETEAGRLR